MFVQWSLGELRLSKRSEEKNQEKSCFEFAHIYWFTDPTFPSVRKEKRVNFTKIMARFIWNLHGEKALSKSNQLM